MTRLQILPSDYKCIPGDLPSTLISHDALQDDDDAMRSLRNRRKMMSTASIDLNLYCATLSCSK